MDDEDRNWRITYALRQVLRFIGVLRLPVPNPWRAVFLRKAIEHDA